MAIVALVVLDLGVLAYGYNPSLPAAQVYPETKVIAFLKEKAGAERVAGVGFALTPNASMLWNLRDVRGYEMTVDRRFQALYDSLATKLPFGVYNLLAKPSYQLLDFLAVKYVVAASGAVDTQAGLPVVFAADGVQVHENRNASPRAFVVGRGRPVPDEQMALQAVRSPGFKVREEVVLEAAAPSFEPTAVVGEAEVSDVNANEVEVVVAANGPAWLVLSDTYDDGWKANVDGRETKVYRANYVMRAVRVDAGKHVVKFTYDPPAFALGLRISIAALLLTAAIALYPFLAYRTRLLLASARR